MDDDAEEIVEDAESERPGTAARKLLSDIRVGVNRFIRSIVRWYQDLRLGHQLLIWIVSTFAMNAIYNLLIPFAVDSMGQIVFFLQNTQLTLGIIIQMILTMLGWLVAQNLILMRSLNRVEGLIRDMDQPSRETDGGRRGWRRYVFREHQLTTSGGGAVGGAIIGGTWGASFGLKGFLIGIVLGVMIGDSVEQLLAGEPAE